MNARIPTPATDRLEALRRVADGARERLLAVDKRVRGARSPLDLLLDIPTSDAAKLAAAHREVEVAVDAMRAEVDAGADERWREYLARVVLEVRSKCWRCVPGP